MTRLTSAPKYGKKHIPHIGKHHYRHDRHSDDWQRRYSMPPYERPKHRRWDIDPDADDALIEATHRA
ncbi:MAG: hypothetical protein PHH36_09500 [Sideroxydans sp.]|nr:hypothetical protein [Sideroxydans sp.]